MANLDKRVAALEMRAGMGAQRLPDVVVVAMSDADVRDRSGDVIGHIGMSRGILHPFHGTPRGIDLPPERRCRAVEGVDLADVIARAVAADEIERRVRQFGEDYR